MILSLFSPFLLLLSLVYSALIFGRNKLFDFGILKVKKLNRPVISIGNISVGGSGKTAVVLEILNHAKGLCVLTRGYKSQASRIKDKSHNVETFDNPDFFGDEPSLIKQKYPDTSVVIDSDRYRGGLYALTKNPGVKAFILDDGFQHRSLYRDLNIIIFDLDIYFKKSGLLPFGKFRETLSSLRRADIVLISKWTHLSLEQKSQALLQLQKYNRNIEFITSKIVDIKNHKNELLTNGKCILVSGLGQPDVFELDFKNSFKSIEVLDHIKYPDHHKYSKNDVIELVMKSKQLGAVLICSEKDYIKFKSLKISLDLIYYTQQQVQLSDICINKVLKVIETKIS